MSLQAGLLRRPASGLRLLPPTLSCSSTCSCCPSRHLPQQWVGDSSSSIVGSALTSALAALKGRRRLFNSSARHLGSAGLLACMASRCRGAASTDKSSKNRRRQNNQVADGSALGSAVRQAEALARSLNTGRNHRDVALDPETSHCAQALQAALSDASAPEVPVDQLLRALDSFSKMRIIHSSLLNVLRMQPRDVWQNLSVTDLVRAISFHARFGMVADHQLLLLWAEVLDEAKLRRLDSRGLVNLVFASASLRMGELSDLRARLIAAAEKADLQRLGIVDLAKLMWGLAKMMPNAIESEEPPPWAEKLAAAVLRASQKPVGQSLAQLLWSFPRLGLASKSAELRDCMHAKTPLGRDAFTELLRQASDTETEVAVLQALADESKSQGLRAAVLNVAVLRCQVAGQTDAANDLLQLMADEALWTPVTYRVAKKLSSTVMGRPVFPGLKNPGQGSHKYVRATYHALSRALEDDPRSIAAGLEAFSEKSWLKFGAADEKGQILMEAWRSFRPEGSAPPPVAVEFGTFLGYSAMKMVDCLGPGARVISFEMDPEVACLAINLIEYAGMSESIDVRIGQCVDLVTNLSDELGPRSVDVVYMDHNQITYHDDLAQLESSRLLADGALFAATQGLKPGAPMLLWHLREAQEAGYWSELDIVSSPDCGCRDMEDWTVLARFRGAKQRKLKKTWTPAPAPWDLSLLAAECNLMRWRTAKGLVDDARWNSFVQHVRKAMHTFDITSTRDEWPDPLVMERARSLTYQRLDY